MLSKGNEDSKPGSYKQLVKEQPFVEEFARKSYQEKDSAMRAANSRAGVRTPGDTEKFMTSDTFSGLTLQLVQVLTVLLSTLSTIKPKG